MTNEELEKHNKDIEQTVSVGCGCVVSFFVSAIAIITVCIGGTPKEQFVPTLLVLLIVFGGGSFLLTYLYGRFCISHEPVDYNNLNCPRCGKKFIPYDKRPSFDSNDGPFCPSCKLPLNFTPSTSDTAAESSPEKTSPERDA